MIRTSGVEVRPLGTISEYRAAVRLQEDTWGEGFSERVPTSLMKVAQRLGGVASGAFLEGGTLVGFVFGVTGVRDGEVVHWSDILAVAREHRSRGIGRALKLHQREQVVGHDVRRMFWTVDPLEAGNHHLNLNVLGGRGVEYHRDFYGRSDSPLHTGLGTDRFVICWELGGGGVPGTGSGATALPAWDPDELPAALGLASTSAGAPPRPGDPRRCDPPFRVAMPADIQTLKAREPETARAWRRATREVLEPALAAGGVVDAVVRRGDVAWLRVSR